MHCVHLYTLKIRNVFSDRPKTAAVCDGSRKFCGTKRVSIIRCSKSAQKSAVQMCGVATVVMETTQLILSQFKNLLS